MKWRRTQGVYHSDCGRFTIKKEPTHDDAGRIVERYPWALYRGKSHHCSYGLLSEAKDGAVSNVG